MTDRTISNLATMLNAFADGIAEVKPIIDTRDPILLRCLRETGKRAKSRSVSRHEGVLEHVIRHALPLGDPRRLSNPRASTSRPRIGEGFGSWGK
jgi:hypothetical protein